MKSYNFGFVRLYLWLNVKAIQIIKAPSQYILPVKLRFLVKPSTGAVKDGYKGLGIP